MSDKPEPTIIDEIGLSPDEIAELTIMSQSGDQGSDQWFEERLGKATASMFSVIVKRDKAGKPYKGYYDYMILLVVERLLGKQKRFSSKQTDWGKEKEESAVAAYEEMYPERDVREVGFVEHHELAAGASTDRLVDEDGTMEVKAPQSDTFIKYFLSHIPDDSPDIAVRKAANINTAEWQYYWDQIQGQLWILNRKWNDHVIHDPELDGVQTAITRIYRDDDYINDFLEPRVREFLQKVDLIENYMRNKARGFVHEVQPEK